MIERTILEQRRRPIAIPFPRVPHKANLGWFENNAYKVDKTQNKERARGRTSRFSISVARSRSEEASEVAEGEVGLPVILSELFSYTTRTRINKLDYSV